MSRRHSNASRRPPVTRHRSIVVAVVVLALVTTACSDGSDASRTELEAEFAGAYPAGPPSGGEVVEIDLVAGESSIEVVDGTATAVWAYNGQVPGPAIEVELGETLRVRLRNELSEATTIHWHGVRVPNDMDGVPGVNQAPVEPGETFTYEFAPPDTGTYWYHSHTNGSEQLERGLYGSLIVTDPRQDSAGFDHDVVWVLDDWLMTDDTQLVGDFNTAADREQNGRWGNLITVNSNTHETIEAAPGDRIRLRMVNASNGRVYTPDFGELTTDLIAVDGLTVGSITTDQVIELAPGNRADYAITLPDTPDQTFTVDDTFGPTPNPLGTLATTERGDNPDATEGDPTGDLPLTQVPEWQDALEAPIDHELVFETHLADGEWMWTINGETFANHTPIEVEQGQFTKIRLSNETHPLHPIHLHGQFFRVLTRNGEPVDEPYFRDTVLLDRLDEVEIALVPLDVGDWVLHCHIQEHADAGMMTVMTVKPASQ